MKGKSVGTNRNMQGKYFHTFQTYRNFAAFNFMKHLPDYCRSAGECVCSRMPTELENDESKRRNRLRTFYRICKGQRARILQESMGMHGVPDDLPLLIDKLRDVLDAMLEDENGTYPMDEILDVSRTLDDLISCYYKTICSDKEECRDIFN